MTEELSRKYGENQKKYQFLVIITEILKKNQWYIRKNVAETLKIYEKICKKLE